MWRIALLPIMAITACDQDIVGILNADDCNPGFVYNDEARSCDCPTGNVQLGDLECRPLRSGEYYGAINGCAVDLSMIIQLGDSLISRDDDFFILVLTEDPDTTRPKTDELDLPYMSPSIGKYFKRPDGRDSLFWDIGIVEYWYTPRGKPSDHKLSWFEGHIMGPDTIQGVIRYGTNVPDYLPAPELDCPVTFVRQR